MPREFSWVAALLGVTLLTLAILGSVVFVGSRVGAVRTQRRRAHALRSSAYYARVIPLLYRYFEAQGARDSDPEQPTNTLPGQIKHLIDTHIEHHGKRTRDAFYLDDDTRYPGVGSRQQAHTAQLAFLDLLLAVLDDYAQEHQKSWLERVYSSSVLSAAPQAELDRYRCLYLTWRWLEEYGWLGSFGSIAALGMEEIGRLNHAGRRLDQKLYRLLGKKRQPPGWEQNWAYHARVDPPLAWKLQRLGGHFQSMTSPFMDICTLVLRYAYHNPSEARARLERLEGRLQAFMQQVGWIERE